MNDVDDAARRTARRRRRAQQVRRRRIAAAGVLVVAVLAIARVGWPGSGDGPASPAAVVTTDVPATGTTPPSPPSSSSSAPASTASPPPPGTVTIAAVGDTMLGSTPELPADPVGMFSGVDRELTHGAQIVFGNLEGTLTDETASKCGSNSSSCFAFRAPPSFARDLRRVGFTVLNNANNHSYDFGAAGQAQTVQALHSAGIAQTGLPGEVTVVHAGRIRVAFVAFAPYSDTASLLDLPAARRLIGRARREADVVVAYMHAGAEGTGAQHVTGQEETYVGEDRGNPEAFAHMAVDAGADLVIASGPHVLRGMEYFHGRLIAYSLGNFAGYHNFGLGGALSTSCILRVTVDGGGRLRAARVVPVTLVGSGQPVLGGDAIAVMNGLSRADFGSHAALIGAGGAVRPPA